MQRTVWNFFFAMAANRELIARNGAEIDSMIAPISHQGAVILFQKTKQFRCCHMLTSYLLYIRIYFYKMLYYYSRIPRVIWHGGFCYFNVRLD